LVYWDYNNNEKARLLAPSKSPPVGETFKIFL
jgi:hypothetical protein